MRAEQGDDRAALNMDREAEASRTATGPVNARTAITPGSEMQAFAAVTGDIMVHEHVEGSQWEPVIASLTGGGYAVAWFGNTGTDKVYVRIFDNAGVPQTGEIVVATGQGGEITYTGEDFFDMRLSIAATDDGGMVLAWVDHDVTLNSGSGPIYSGQTHVFAQRVAANGSLVGSQIEVAQAPVFGGGVVYMNPTVGAFPGGGFFVTFNDNDGLNGRIFGANNSGGAQFLLTANEVDYRDEQSVATLTNGSLIAVWEAALQPPGQPAQALIEARLITPSGAGTLFTIAGASPGAPFDVAVAALSGGGFVATWCADVDGQADVYAQTYTAIGSPVSGVFRVNAYVPGEQSEPNVIGLPDGGFVISYGSLDSVDPASAGIYAQRFSATGAGLGAPFRVNDVIDGEQFQGYQEGVEVLSNGNIVFTWMGIGVYGGPANDTFNTFMRIFPGNELPPGQLSGDIPVADHGNTNQYIPVVAALAGGGYATAWFEEGGGADKLFVRLFDNAGAPRGAAIEVSSGEFNFFNLDFFHVRVSIAATDDGGFVLTWVDHDVTYNTGTTNFSGESHVYAQRFSATGSGGPRVDVAVAAVNSGSPVTMDPAVSALPGGGYLVIYGDRAAGATTELTGRIMSSGGVGGTPFTLSASGNGYTLDGYSTATLADGRLAVVWSMENTSQGLADQLHVRFVGAGGPGAEFQVNIPGEENIVSPAVAALAGGGFVVAWAGGVVGDSNSDIYAQIYAANGSAVGGVFRVNSYTPFGQGEPSIVGMPDGGFVISYQSPDSIEPFSTGIYAQRFSATGAAIGEAYRVNDATADPQFQFLQEGVDVLSNGNLVFGWLTQSSSANDPYDAYTRIFSGDPGPAGPIGGTNANDLLIGTSGNDSIDGSGGNDSLFGGGGNDSLDGGAGTDTADYAGLQSNYRVTVSNGVYTVVDLRAGSPDGTDTLRNIEQLRFNGGTPVNIQDAVVPEVGAGTPIGGEVLGNVTVTGSQREPVVAALSGGGFVMLWVDPAADGSGSGIFARRFGADGAPIGGEFGIPSSTANSQSNPSVVGLSDGGFMAVWYSSAGVDIYARRFSANGTPQGAEFRVNTTTANDQLAPAIAANASGFVVTWYSFGANAADVIARAYNADGTPATGEIVVNTTLSGNQSFSSVTMLAGGGFVVTWEGADASGRGIFARQFTAAGAPVGAEFLVNTVTNGDQELPAVTALANGGYVIAWTDSGVHARLYGADGQPIAAQFDVATAGDDVGLTALANGGFAVSWAAAGTGFDIFAQIYDAAGAKVGGRFTINETLTGSQLNGGPGALAQLADGTVAFAWSGNGTGDADGVFVRRFSVGVGSGSSSLTGTSGNDILAGTAAGDVFDLRQGGDDIVTGGDGDDIFHFGPTLTAADRVDGGSGYDRVGLNGDYSVGVTLAAATLVNIEEMVLTGGAYRIVTHDTNVAAGRTLQIIGTALSTVQRLEFDGSAELDGSFAIYSGAGNDVLRGGVGADTLVAGAGADQLDGGGGADRLYGGAGDDTYYVDQQSDLAFEDVGGGSDTVVARSNFYLYANIENLTLAAGAGAIFGVGNELANTMTGNEGANTLLGGAGIDTVRGGAGADTLYGEDGNDQLFGDADNDLLVGGQGDDLIDGGAGDDRLYGNAGDDSFYVDSGSDLTFEQAGEGTDTVYATISGGNSGVYLYANIENLVLLGTTGFGVGNDLANVMTGNASGNYLLGGDGADRLNGKAGNDVLFGQSGADTFVFEHGTGGDVIGDFAPGTDKIDLTAIGYTWQQVQNSFHQNGGDLAIDLGGGDFIVLNGVTAAQLHQSDFVLASPGGAMSADIAAIAYGAVEPVPVDPVEHVRGHISDRFWVTMPDL